MGLYGYEVVTSSGEIISGRIQAEKKSTAIEQLQKKGYMVVEIKEIQWSLERKLIFSPPKVKIGEISLFSRQLAAMLEAGIPITRALFTLSKQASNSTLQKALDDIARNVEGGMGVTQAFSAYPSIFNNLYLGMIGAGEIGGNLGETLLRLSDQIQKEKILKDNMRSATFYPVTVACFAIVVLLAMLIFLVPIFQGFFPENTSLPAATKLIIGLSESLRFNWYIWVLIILALITGAMYYLKGPKGRQVWDRVRFRIPAFGPLFHKAVIARFSRTLATLLANGIPIIQALETSGGASGSPLVEKVVGHATIQIQEGKGIADPLEESNFFSPMVVHMIRVGEETGALPSLLNRVAEFYEDEVAALTKGLTALIEPLLLIFVGILVGGMLISLYLPIFTVITQTGMG